MTDTADTAVASIVIPIHNEAVILEGAVREFHSLLSRHPWPFEIVLAENGSTDDTRSIAARLADDIDEVRFFSIDAANYGRALKAGIQRARADYIVCEEIDLCDIEFFELAMGLLERKEADLVIGSKAMQGAVDARPFIRRFATRTLNRLLRLLVGFRGTDTHGLKAFRNTALREVVGDCVLDRDLFASELVIRGERAGLGLREVPITLAEKRPPSIQLSRRVPAALRGLYRLVRALHNRHPKIRAGTQTRADSS